MSFVFLHYSALSSVGVARVILSISSREKHRAVVNQRARAQQSLTGSVLVVPVKRQTKIVRHSVAAERVKKTLDMATGSLLLYSTQRSCKLNKRLDPLKICLYMIANI